MDEDGSDHQCEIASEASFAHDEGDDGVSIMSDSAASECLLEDASEIPLISANDWEDSVADDSTSSDGLLDFDCDVTAFEDLEPTQDTSQESDLSTLSSSSSLLVCRIFSFTSVSQHLIVTTGLRLR